MFFLLCPLLRERAKNALAKSIDMDGVKARQSTLGIHLDHLHNFALYNVAMAVGQSPEALNNQLTLFTFECT
jgi:hypothetical protein